MEKLRILVLSVSAGNGHVRAAEGIVAGAAKWFPGCETRHLDLMTLVPALFRKAYKDAYLKLVQRHPELWGYLYTKADRLQAESALSRLQRSLESASNKSLLRHIQEYKPDHIVCTHFMPLQVLARWRNKGRISQPVWTCITDFVAHRFWLEPGQAGYFTACEEDAWRLRLRGLTTERVIASGIPVMPEFQPEADRHAARQTGAQQFGLDPAKLTLLMMGGGAGMGNMLRTAEEMLSLPGSFQLAVLAGKNHALLRDLEALASSSSGRLLPLGFTTEVAALLAASDLVISKPGGLTTVECLAMGKPMVAFAPIPGQEEHNADYLLENGAALKAVDNPGLLWRIRMVLENPDVLNRLAANAAVLGRPEASRTILATITGLRPLA